MKLFERESGVNTQRAQGLQLPRALDVADDVFQIAAGLGWWSSAPLISRTLSTLFLCWLRKDGTLWFPTREIGMPLGPPPWVQEMVRRCGDGLLLLIAGWGKQ
eukprot:3480501-Amphidinium_carterae.1